MSEAVALPGRKRRWSHFSLRGLFVALTLLAIGLGWIVYYHRWVRDRQNARLWLNDRECLVVQSGSTGFIMQREDGKILQSKDGGVTSREGHVLNLPSAPWGVRFFGEPTVHFIAISSEHVMRRQRLDLTKSKPGRPSSNPSFPRPRFKSTSAAAAAKTT